MNNLQDDEWDFADIKRVSLGLREARRYRLRRGDLLFNRTNSKELVGKCGVFNERGVWVFASYLIRVCTDAEKLLPQFAAFFINSPAGRIQIDRVSRQIIGMTNVNAEELRELAIPLPPMAKQRELVDVMETARSARRTKLAEADALLAGMDAYLLETLGLVLPAVDARRVFCIAHGNLGARLDPHFHAPPFAQVESALVSAQAKPLGVLAEFSRELWEPAMHDGATFRYIEISGVRTDVGEATCAETETSQAPSRARMQVREGDILVSLTRPHHGAVAQVTAELDGCIASTGFAVLRKVRQDQVTPDYLWCALRTQVCLRQMLRHSSGGNYPAITEAELANVLVPVPDLKTQQSIAAEIRRRCERARVLRAEAEAGWAEAKRWFEEQLLGPAP